jgi:hypothetical protein
MSAADLSCSECHNDTNIITGKQVTWSASFHGSGTTTAYAGGRDGCAACHSGSGFSDRIAAGLANLDDYVTTDANPSRIDCRACHQVHESYTSDDWALETTDPVTLYAFEGVTFDGGMGNLCANCHQPRRPFPAATDGMVAVDSTHWGAHHGPVASMLMGVGGGLVEGKPASHATMVENTCVSCHMGDEAAAHSFTPNVAACTGCHADATNFDINSVQTEVEAKLEEVKAALQAKGLLDAEGTIVVGDYPEAEAAALWNFIMVEEDKSLGVHNSAYANAMLDAALEALK